MKYFNKSVPSVFLLLFALFAVGYPRLALALELIMSNEQGELTSLFHSAMQAASADCKNGLIKGGNVLRFGAKTFKIQSVLGCGLTTAVYDIGDGKALRLSFNGTSHYHNNTYDGSIGLEAYGVTSPKVFREESKVAEYLVVEKVRVDTTLADFIAAYTETPENRAIANKLIDFAKSTYMLNHLDDFRPINITYDGNKWMFLDWQSQKIRPALFQKQLTVMDHGGGVTKAFVKLGILEQANAAIAEMRSTVNLVDKHIEIARKNPVLLKFLNQGVEQNRAQLVNLDPQELAKLQGVLKQENDVWKKKVIAANPGWSVILKDPRVELSKLIQKKDFATLGAMTEAVDDENFLTALVEELEKSRLDENSQTLLKTIIRKNNQTVIKDIVSKIYIDPAMLSDEPTIKLLVEYADKDSIVPLTEKVLKQPRVYGSKSIYWLLFARDNEEVLQHVIHSVFEAHAHQMQDIVKSAIEQRSKNPNVVKAIAKSLLSGEQLNHLAENSKLLSLALEHVSPDGIAELMQDVVKVSQSAGGARYSEELKSIISKMAGAYDAERLKQVASVSLSASDCANSFFGNILAKLQLRSARK